MFYQIESVSTAPISIQYVTLETRVSFPKEQRHSQCWCQVVVYSRQKWLILFYARIYVYNQSILYIVKTVSYKSVQ